MYDGCEATLAFYETKDHEATCRGQNYICIFCSYEASNGSQLVGHCEKMHPQEVFTRKAGLKIGEQEEMQMIYYDDSHIVLFEMTFERSCAMVSVSYFNGLLKDKQCRVNFHANNLVLSFPLNCNQYGNEKPDIAEVKLAQYFPELGDFLCNLEINSEARSERLQRHMKNRLKLMRNMCKQKDALLNKLVGNLKPIEQLLPKRNEKYLHSKFIMRGEKIRICGRCSKTIFELVVFDLGNNQFCSGCVYYASIDCLEASYQCSCGETFPVGKYHKHGSCRDVRRYKCVVRDCPCVLNLEDLRKHWHAKEQLKIGLNLDLTDIEKQTTTTFYWNLDKELFFVQFTCGKIKGIFHFDLLVRDVDVLGDFNRDMYVRYEEADDYGDWYKYGIVLKGKDQNRFVKKTGKGFSCFRLYQMAS